MPVVGGLGWPPWRVQRRAVGLRDEAAAPNQGGTTERGSLRPWTGGRLFCLVGAAGLPLCSRVAHAGLTVPGRRGCARRTCALWRCRVTCPKDRGSMIRCRLPVAPDRNGCMQRT